MLRKPTEWKKATVGTVPYKVLGPETDAPPQSVRCVTLIVRDEPEIAFAIDQDPDSIDARDSYWPVPPGSKTISIRLMPAQWIVARALDAHHELSIIVEYHDG